MFYGPGGVKAGHLLVPGHGGAVVLVRKDADLAEAGPGGTNVMILEMYLHILEVCP
jgi:hypothetical protein